MSDRFFPSAVMIDGVPFDVEAYATNHGIMHHHSEPHADGTPHLTNINSDGTPLAKGHPLRELPHHHHDARCARRPALLIPHHDEHAHGLADADMIDRQDMVRGCRACQLELEQGDTRHAVAP